MKKFFLAILLCGVIFLFSSAQVNNPADTFGQEADTTAKAGDSLKTVIKELYETESPAKLGKTYKAFSAPRLNPRAAGFVQDYMAKNSEELLKMKGWARPYFTMMDGVLTQYDLPKELKYLAVIESHLKPTLVSWAGAVGPWQLMQETARENGLRVNRYVDERTNYVKSTHAAARYLTLLYKEFGDWLLVIAAYNGGPGNVTKAIRKSGSRNFWDLQFFLPAESRNHVKKFISTHYVFEGQGGLTTLTKQETKEQMTSPASLAANRNLTNTELETSKSQNISGKYHSVIIAKNILMDINEFNRYNPAFDKAMASAENTYELKLPSDKMELFIANKYQILNESIQLMLTTASSEIPGARKSGVDSRLLVVGKK
jgi:membrane-bound lytic murein transglycosylase D